MQDDTVVQQLSETNSIYNSKSEGVLIQTCNNTEINESDH